MKGGGGLICFKLMFYITILNIQEHFKISLLPGNIFTKNLSKDLAFGAVRPYQPIDKMDGEKSLIPLLSENRHFQFIH